MQTVKLYNRPTRRKLIEYKIKCKISDEIYIGLCLVGKTRVLQKYLGLDNIAVAYSAGSRVFAPSRSGKKLPFMLLRL